MNTKAIQQAINIARVFEADMDLDGAAQMAQDELEEKDVEIAKKDKAIKSAIDAISLLPEDIFGSVPDTPVECGWWIRDELIARLTAAI